VIARRLGRALDWRIAGLLSRLEAQGTRSAAIEGSVKELEQRIVALTVSVEELLGQTSELPRLAGETERMRILLEQRFEPMLRALVDEEPENRRRLGALRASPEYERPYTDPDPLVSITVASTGRDLLFERALPSLLSQSYSNLEVIVVGDVVAPHVGERIRALGDPRVRFANLTQRTLAHSDPRRHWLVGSTMARNEATRLASGRWLVHFDDDDNLRPNAIASLLELAREQRAEVAYSGIEEHHPDGNRTILEGFPPRLGTFSWAAALVHGGLRFFERELLAAHLEIPGDMYALERMLRAGVRFATSEEIALDYFPSTLWESPAAEPKTAT
jgi:Glycosyl transferase family 2